MPEPTGSERTGSERTEATERLIATLIAGQARVRHIAHSRLSFPAALAIEMRAQTGLAERWSVAEAVARLQHETPRPPDKRVRIAPSVQAWTEDLGQDDLVSEPVPRAEDAELAADVLDERHPVAEEETSEAELEPGPPRGRGGVTFSEDDSDEELVQRVESRRGDNPTLSDEDSDDPDTEEVADAPPAAALLAREKREKGIEKAAPPTVGEDEGHTFVPPTMDEGAPAYWERSREGDELADDDATALHPESVDEDDDAKASASSTFPPPAEEDDLEVEDLRTGEIGDDLDDEDLRTGEVDDIGADALEEDELELDDDSVEVELDESEAAEEEPRVEAKRASTPPPVNEWEEEDRTMLSGSAAAQNEWDGEERTVLHGSEMANVLEESVLEESALEESALEEDDVPGPPSRTRAFVDEEDSDSVGELSDDDIDESATGAAAVRILGVGKAEPVAPKKRGRKEDSGDPGTEEGIVAAAGAEEGDDWGAGLAATTGGLSLLAKRKPANDLPAIPRLTEDESQDVGGAAADGAVVDLDGGSLQEVEEVDPAQLRSFQRAAEDAVSKGDMHQAIVHYRDMLDLAPENLDAYLGRGRCLVHLGDYAAAMSDFQRAEDLDPKSPLPLVEMGNLFFARKEYLRAIQFFDTALELDDKNAWAWCYRGICHHYRKKHKEAFQDLQKAYSLDPEIPNIRRYVQMAVKAMEKSNDGA